MMRKLKKCILVLFAFYLFLIVWFYEPWVFIKEPISDTYTQKIIFHSEIGGTLLNIGGGYLIPKSWSKFLLENVLIRYSSPMHHYLDFTLSKYSRGKEDINYIGWIIERAKRHGYKVDDIITDNQTASTHQLNALGLAIIYGDCPLVKKILELGAYPYPNFLPVSKAESKLGELEFYLKSYVSHASDYSQARNNFECIAKVYKTLDINISLGSIAASTSINSHVSNLAQANQIAQNAVDNN